MKQERYEMLVEIINEKRLKGLWNIDIQKGTIHTSQGLVTAVDNYGYPVTGANYKGKTRVIRVHEVISILGGLYPVDLTINHIDGKKTNNCIANLEAISARENFIHAVKTGAWSNYKLSELDVKGIKILSLKGVSQRKIAELFNVSAKTIRDIQQGKRHKGVTI
jgi:hypothetical protein